MNHFVLILYLYCILQTVYSKKNIVFILTDDQDLVLESLTAMKYTQEHIANNGITFTNAFVTTPICCPSRSSILTGKYVHNHNTWNNSLSGNCASSYWRNNHEQNTFATVLKNNGYKTFYAGKYLNQYGMKNKYVPPGWDWWIGLNGNSKYYKYSLNINGTKKVFKDTYLTDLMKNYSLEFLNQKNIIEQPFLLVLSTPASHAPFTAAPRHIHLFPNVKSKRTPNFNYTTNDKHWLLRMNPVPLPYEAVSILDNIQRSRWQTLLAVDEMVNAVIIKLKELSILNNTYIIFTSDNGFHIGQFSQPWDKRQPYETDIRVPFLVRGPGIPIKSLSQKPILNIDIGPTIIDMAGLEAPYPVDGVSFLKDITNTNISVDEFDRTFIVEYRGEHNPNTVSEACPWKYDINLSVCSEQSWCKCQDAINNTYTCVRKVSSKDNLIYCQFLDDENFVEVYDLNNDPYQLHNIANEMPSNFHIKYQKILTSL